MQVLDQLQFDFKYTPLEPAQKISDDFLQTLPAPVGLWLPSKLANTAVDFTPFPQKHFGTLNGGITTTPGGSGVLGAAWQGDGTSGFITLGSAVANVLSASNDFSLLIAFRTSADIVTAQTILGSSIASTNRLYAQISSSSLKIGIYNGAFVGCFFRAVAASSDYVLIYTKTGTTYTASLNNLPMTSGASPVTDAGNNCILFAGLNPGVRSYFGGQIRQFQVFNVALTTTQVSDLYNCLLTGEPFPLFQPDELVIGSVLSSSTLNLTAKSISQSFASGNEAVNRKISSQAISQSFASGDEAVNRKISSQAISQSFASGNEAVNRTVSAQAISQSFASGHFTTQPIIVSGPPGAISQSFASGFPIISKGLSSKVIASSYSEARISIVRPASSKSIEQSYAEGTIYLTKKIFFSSLAISQSFARGAMIVNRPLSSSVIAASHASGNVQKTINLQSKVVVESSASSASMEKLVNLYSEAISQSFATGTNAYYGNKFVELTSVRTVSQDAENLGPIDNVAQELIRLRETSQQQIVGGGNVIDGGN